jgi:hypothetical protein
MRSAGRVADIDADASGDVASRLRPYDQATNRALIERSTAASATSFRRAPST